MINFFVLDKSIDIIIGLAVFAIVYWQHKKIYGKD